MRRTAPMGPAPGRIVRVLGWVVLCGLACQGCLDAEPGEDSASGGSWSVEIAGPEEPGERLIVRGRVLWSDDGAPVAGASVRAFHTDARGWYGEDRWDAEDRPRLTAVAVTDAAGRFEFRTIRPGAYPVGGQPAHVHFKIEARDLPRQRHQILYFEGDPYLDERHLRDVDPDDRLSPVRPLRRTDEGDWLCERDLLVTGGSRENG